MKLPLLAITVHRPWGFAIAALDKRIENRTWNCRLPIGAYIAIHNGKKWDPEAAEFCRQRNNSSEPTPESDPPQAIIAIARFSGNITESDSEWFCGPVGWQLSEVITIAPVPCPGRQGFWMPPDDVLLQVRTNYAKVIQ